MNHLDIKQRAQIMVKEKFKDFWSGYVIIIAINFLIDIVLTLLFKDGILKTALSLVSSLFLSTLSVGLYAYILKIVRNQDYNRQDIFNFVGQVMPIFCISCLVTILIMLGSLLFIIPGIIIALAYSMVFYLYADDSSHLPMEYLNMSKKLMKGYKLDYFLFILSFFGWILLSVLTFGIALIYVIPYMSFAETIYYDELTKISHDE